MSALPAQLVRGTTDPRPVAADRACWIPIADAARLMDVHRTTLLRDCPDMEQRGDARRMPLVLGGRLVWHIHNRYDTRLVRADVERTETGESAVHVRLKQATKPQKVEAARKVQLVVAFRAWMQTLKVGVAKAYPGFCAMHPGAPSLRSMWVWHDRCPASDDLPGCMAALLDTRGRPREGAPGMSVEAWQLYCDLYFKAPPQSHGKCWRIVRDEASARGWVWPGDDTVARIRDKRFTPSQIAMAREGEDAWSRKFKAPIDQDPEAWAVNECWEGDNTDLDFFVRVLVPAGDGTHKWVATRPVLTSFIDRRSRRIVGWQLNDRANATTIRRALISGVRACGAPQHVWIDNGKDFASRAMIGQTKAQRRAARKDSEVRTEATSESALYLQLGIKAHFAIAYNHNGKARLERWHGTLHRDHDREYASWCGSDQGDRPDPDALKAAVSDVMALPTLDDARCKLALWIDWYNARDEHAIDDLVVHEADGARRRLSPIEFHERRLPNRGVVDEDSLALLVPTWSIPLAVTKRGVGVRIEGHVWHYGAMHPALEMLKGTKARVYVAHDDDRLDEVTIYDTDFRFLCSAPKNQLSGGAGVTRQDMREAVSLRRAQRRWAKERPSLVETVLTDTELVARKARQRQIAETNARLRESGHLAESQSVPYRLVSTPVDGASRVAKARKAVGSEHDAMPRCQEEDDILLMLACAGPLDGPSTAVERASQWHDNVDLMAMDVRTPSPRDDTPDGDDGCDILATLGGTR